MKKLNYAASHQTVRISAKRFEQSPFFDLYANPDMILGVYARRFYALSLGEDPLERYWTLRRKVVLFEVPERPIEISGPDAATLLEKVFARPVSNLKQGRARYAVACTPAGGILMDGVLIARGADRFWYVQADGEFDTWLAAHSDGLDVNVSDPKSWVLQIQGPNAYKVLHDATGGGLDESFGYFHTGEFDLGGQRLLVSRTGWTGELGFEVYTEGAATDCIALWEHLKARGEPHGMQFSSLECMGIRRIEAGILDNGTDMDPSMTPYEAGLGAFVDLDKQGFVGREALLDADRRSLLFGLTCAGDVPFAGLELLDGDAVVGRMTAGAWSPFLDCGVGYVRFASPGDWLGETLSLRTREGTMQDCKVVELPFYDRDKRIPRGLDRTIPAPPA